MQDSNFEVVVMSLVFVAGVGLGMFWQYSSFQGRYCSGKPITITCPQKVEVVK